MTFVSCENYRDAQGGIDWKAYRHAKVEQGETCYRCGGQANIWSKGHRDLCSDCREMDDDAGEVSHEIYVRCPQCRTRHQAHELHDQSHEDGEHDVDCPSCGRSFTFTTSVSYSFESPELATDDPDAGDDDQGH